MPGIGGNALSGGEFKDRQPYCDKHVALVSVTELVVYMIENIGRAVAHLGAVLDQGLGDHHEKRRGHALSRNIGHHHGKMVVVHQEEVIEVAADLLGRSHAGKNIKVIVIGESRKHAGQHIRLDPSGHIQLRTDPFLLRRDRSQMPHIVCDLFFHPVDGLGQYADFILSADAVGQLLLRRFILPRKAARLFRDLRDRLDELLTQIKLNPDDFQGCKHQQSPEDMGYIAHLNMTDFVHRPLYTDDRLGALIRVLHRNHGSDVVGRTFIICTVQQQEFLIRAPLIQVPVFQFVFVVGCGSDISELIGRIFALPADGGKEKGNLVIVWQLRPNHIDKGCVERIAELVQPQPGFAIKLAVLSGLKHLIKRISVDEECSCVCNLKRVLRVLVIERLTGDAVSEDA